MKAALIVLDGWGIGDHTRTTVGTDSEPGSSETRLNAVLAADTPNFDRLSERGAYGTLVTSGHDVGLPEGQMGNSEVGHLNIGAGRVVYQEYTRINDAIAEQSSAGNQNPSSSDDIQDGSFAENEAIESAFDYAAANDGRVHFMGLVSKGGVHSDQAHLRALIECVADRGVEAVTHAFTDGRDTAPTAGTDFLAEIEETIAAEGTGHIATVSGRYYAMDRDQNWERTKRAYDTIVNRDAEHVASTALDAVEQSYERGDTDEFVEPTCIEGGPALEDGDAVVFFNFRADRARQLVRMLADIDPVWPFETTPPEIRLVTMTEYDETFEFPVAFKPTQPEDTLGEVLAANGLTQLRIAESEKYAHVTYFLNGGREVEFDGEIRKIVDSPDVPTYDQRPEMSAAEVTDTAMSLVEADDPDVLVLNYANPDMVGHTGDYEAAIESVEAVDEQLDRLVPVLQRHGAHVLVTADHGNAEDMGTPDEPHTAHTFNPVPFVYLSPENGDRTVREGGRLADVAPTMLELIGVETPAAMTGESLLQ